MGWALEFIAKRDNPRLYDTLRDLYRQKVASQAEHGIN